MQHTKQLPDLLPLCPLCGRPLSGTLDEDHHLIPKTFKGKDTVRIHKICHQRIHSCFDERSLLNYYNTIERILENDEMQRFVKWVSKKDPRYYSKNDDTESRRRKR